jgi:tRNA-dihydrouridine synthase
VLVGRGVLRNPWILAQAADLASGRAARMASFRERGQFLLEYIQLLLDEGVNEADGFRHVAPGVTLAESVDDGRPARGHERWVINKLRALCSWYSKGLDGGSQLRVRVNSAERISQLREMVEEFFLTEGATVP